jgi:hypothetical protein
MGTDHVSAPHVSTTSQDTKDTLPVFRMKAVPSGARAERYPGRLRLYPSQAILKATNIA